MDGPQMLQTFNRCFSKWGLPKKIKFDNGLPIVNPHQPDTPTLLVLWWEGLGIVTHRNAPACPQQNATVEGLQGICARWVCPKDQPDVEAFQRNIDEQIRIQREVYLLTREHKKTRMELYPELTQNPRQFDPNGFSWDRVKTFLANQVWNRTVASHCLTVFNQQIYVGKQFSGQKMTITYDPIEEKMVVRALDGRLIKVSDKEFVSKDQILNYANLSRNE